MRQARGQPLLLRLAQHTARRIGQSIATHDHATAAAHEVGASLVVAVLAAVQRPQVSQRAPRHAVVDAHLAGLLRVRPQAQRHVLKVSLVRRRPPLQKHRSVGEVAVQVVGVVVHHLVVVPGHEPRVGRVAGLQVDIALVVRVAGAVSLQRVGHAAFVSAHLVLLVAAFVDVVAHEQHQVQVLRGHVAVRGVVALLVMLARRQAHAQASHRLVQCRAGAGAAHRADRVAAGKTVPIMPPRLQPIGQHMQAVAPAGVGAQAPLAQGLAQSLVGKQLTHHGRARCLAGCIGFVDEQTRPQHHAARLWLATGHAQTERIDLPARRRALGLHARRDPRRQRSGQSHAVQIAARPGRAGD